MNYDWRGELRPQELDLAWYDEQDRRSIETHRHFATDRVPFDRLIPYDSLRTAEVLEIGVGSGLHAELLARAGANLTGIDLTDAAIHRTRRRFELKGLQANLEQWDAERPRPDFDRRFDFAWSWGVVHASARTARIVRNVANWLVDGGRFAGMVYHRDSTSSWTALLRDGVLRGRLASRSVDEILWQSSDGFTARHYPADQWQDLLLGFFEGASVDISGYDSDVVPLPRRLRQPLFKKLSNRRIENALHRRGSFVIFNAAEPLR